MVDKGQGTRQLTTSLDQPRELVLPGVPQSAREARQFAREYVMRTEPTASDDYVDAIVLATSELVTNSIRYGTEPGDSLALKLHTCHGRTRVEVRDPVRRRPRLRSESHSREGGRGLVILDGLCHWGVDEAPFGKVVWAEVIAK
ncbi:ATP-binding protein [Streptomyces sp. NPDC006992]|uniref:ATP-binding protein n=1 Tax=Streptomyces sp. NPDC006992 TaxID=3155601 RepID=UPI0033CD7E7A